MGAASVCRSTTPPAATIAKSAAPTAGRTQIPRMAPASSLDGNLRWNALSHKSLRAVDGAGRSFRQSVRLRKFYFVKKFQEISQFLPRLHIQLSALVRRAQKLPRGLVSNRRMKTRFNISPQDIRTFQRHLIGRHLR